MKTKKQIPKRSQQHDFKRNNADTIRNHTEGVALQAPALQLKSDSILKEDEKIQLKTGQGLSEEDKTNNDNLPKNVQTKMENTLGHDFSNVKYHTNSSKAKEVGALAYTQGNDVHFAPNQFQPKTKQGQELIGHELAHVVQQSQGRVQATTQTKGIPVNDDKGLEKEADDMGKKVVNNTQNSNPSKKLTNIASSKTIQHKKDKKNTIGFLGLNPKAKLEQKELKKRSKDNVIGAIDNDQKERLFDTQDKLAAYITQHLKIYNPYKFKDIFYLLKGIDKSYREQVIKLVQLFQQAEKSEISLQRLVFSGHHYEKGHSYDNTIAEKSEMEGDDENGRLDIRKVMDVLTKVFPKAASQVKHIMFSACRTHEYIDYCKTKFPNLKSIWVYNKGKSPVIGGGSTKHIKKWEENTKGNKTPRKEGKGFVPKYGKAYTKVFNNSSVTEPKKYKESPLGVYENFYPSDKVAFNALIAATKANAPPLVIKKIRAAIRKRRNPKLSIKVKVVKQADWGIGDEELKVSVKGNPNGKTIHSKIQDISSGKTTKELTFPVLDLFNKKFDPRSVRVFAQDVGFIKHKQKHIDWKYPFNDINDTFKGKGKGEYKIIGKLK